jgi:YggT family protein
MIRTVLPKPIMLYQIISLLLEVVTGVVGGSCLLRLYMQHQRIPMSARSGNPLGRFVFALTDWLVLPLRRILPKAGRIDLGSLVAAFLVMLLQAAVIALLFGASLNPVAVLIGALLDLLGLVLSGMFWLVVVSIFVSWLRVDDATVYWLQSLVEPLLRPVRRFLPTVAGLDLSPMVVILLIKVLEMVLHGWRSSI